MSGSDECSGNEECGLGSSSSSSFGLSSSIPIPEFHLECRDNACTVIEGSGEDLCSLFEESDCLPSISSSSSSSSSFEFSFGISSSFRTDFHLECVNSACELIPGDGVDACSPFFDCGETTHAECQNSRCIAVSGGGANDCQIDSQCDPNSSSSSFSVSSPESCNFDGDCPGEEVCLEGRCFSSVVRDTFCGNGIKNPGEECEDGNRDNGDGCDSNCKEESLVASASMCGNGLLEDREECDDTNVRDNDGCSSTCLLEIGICGDGVVQTLLGEHCENSSHDPSLPYQCVRCRFLSMTCGDSTVDAGEECDAGPRNSTSPNVLCRPDCSSSRCGDKTLDTSELCDDGNRLNGDGCDRYCRIEKNPTQVASDISDPIRNPQFTNTGFPQFQNIQQYGFPQYPNFKQLPYQLPLAQLRPIVQQKGPVGDTGPAAVAIVGAGAAAGLSWIRRKRR